MAGRPDIRDTCLAKRFIGRNHESFIDPKLEFAPGLSSKPIAKMRHQLASENKTSNDPQFRNEFHKGVVNLVHTTGWLNNQLRVFFQRFDLTYQQYNALKIIQKNYPDGVSINTIKRNMPDRMSDVSRIVERLRKKELAYRTYPERDRRAVLINVTQLGLQLLEEIESDREFVDSLLYKLDYEEIHTLNAILEKVRN
jgi:DNA-binding MarR family transcriptional regulator